MEKNKILQSLWRNVKTKELVTSSNVLAYTMPKGTEWVNEVSKSTWVKVSDEEKIDSCEFDPPCNYDKDTYDGYEICMSCYFHLENGCRYGQADGPDDVVKECDCND